VLIARPYGLLGREQVAVRSVAEPEEPLRPATTATKIAGVEPLLHRDVRLSFKLEIAFGTIRAVVVLQGTLDIDGMRVVSFNEVTVIAVH